MYGVMQLQCTRVDSYSVHWCKDSVLVYSYSVLVYSYSVQSPSLPALVIARNMCSICMLNLWYILDLNA